MLKITQALVLFLVSLGTAYADYTTITSTSGAEVQCNSWGWVRGNLRTVWKSTCTPLEVKTARGKILSVPTTAGQCQGGDKPYALYNHDQYRNTVDFVGCA